MTPRKSPIRHKVKSHTRQGRRVNSYVRGSGKSKTFIKKQKINQKLNVWTGTLGNLKRSFRVSRAKGEEMLKAWDYFGETGDGEWFDSLFDFGWDGDSLDFKYNKKSGIATITTTYVRPDRKD